MAYSHKLVKRSFFSGKYDREFSGQENAITAAGMVYCKNVLSSPQGECKARPGTEWLTNLDNKSVIIPYRRRGGDLALVFSDSVMTIKDFSQPDIDYEAKEKNLIVWENTGNNTPATTPVSVTGDVNENNNAYLYWTANPGNVITSTSNVFTSENAKVYLNMGFTPAKRIVEISFRIFGFGGYSTQIPYLNNIYLQYSDDNNQWATMPLSDNIIFTAEAVDGYGWTKITLKSELSESHQYWRIFLDFSRLPSVMVNRSQFRFSLKNLVYEESTTTVSSFTTVYTNDNLKNLKYSQQGADLIICDGQHNPYKFSMTGNVPSFQELTYDFLVSDGKPSCVRFFQNRLFYGGFETYPTRVRGSKFGDYTDFTIVTQDATVADPINIECNQFTEKITDLWGGFTVLYAQSSEGIAFVTGMTSTPDFTLRCTEKASGITPTMKDNIMYYVGYDRRKIYAFSFDNNIQQFVAPDVSLYWQEVLKNRISEIHYVDSRCKAIVGSLDDGTGFLLLNEGGSVGYFPFDISGKIFDVSIIKKGEDANIFFVVDRGSYWTIEKLHLPEFMLETNAFEQTNWERNLATQQNLLKSPYFDCWKKVVNEHNFAFSYDAETGNISPVQTDVELDVDFSEYVGKTVRFYYGFGIRDYYDLLINAVVDAQNNIISVSCDNTITNTTFNKFQLPIESIETTEPEIQAQDNGVYKGNFMAEDGVVTFNEPMFNVQYGIPYRKIAVIEDNRSYLRQKAWGAIAVNIIDTMALKIGIKLDRLTNIVKWDGNQFFDSNLIMKNGTLICNISDIPQYEKQLIFMTDEGLPFTLLAIETAGEISDKGAN